MSNPSIPTAEQLAASRTTLWHHGGDALLTLESLRAWINYAGFVLFTPRAQQLPAPAPSLVEAVLGTPNPTPALADTEQARILTARLIAEGSAVPLNLLGTPGATGDTPDFLCSAAVFSYIFTLRGDKAWKQPPATNGPVKVSPLAANTYELLAARVTMSAADLATELGKEVTEAAVLRGLLELWSHLRVIPIPQANAGSVLWELSTTRFTKHIKAGANAGQPSALSALISLYLGMAVVATEEEIETILSPLASRSRIRDVVHALMGARQLESIAVDGRTVLHVTGDLPSYTSTAPEEAVEVEQIAASAPEEASEDGAAPSRITKFVPKPRKTGTGFATRFTPRPGPGGPSNDRERRPFQKKPFDSSRPSFSKPWNEERPTRPSINAEGATDARPTRPTFRDKPTFRRDENSGPPRREFTSRSDASRSFSPRSSSEDQRSSRKTFSKPGTFGRKREESTGRPSFDRSGSRPPRRDLNASARPSAGSRPPYGGNRPQRPFNDRPFAGGERRPGSYSPRPPASREGFAGRKPYVSRESNGSFPPHKPFAPDGSKPPFASDRDAGAGGKAPRKVFRKFDAPRFEPRGSRPDDSSSGRPKSSYGKSDGFAGKKPFARTSSKPPGAFAKFADGNKPFRKPGPGGKKFGAKPSGPTGAYRKRKPEEGVA